MRDHTSAKEAGRDCMEELGRITWKDNLEDCLGITRDNYSTTDHDFNFFYISIKNILFLLIYLLYLDYTRARPPSSLCTIFFGSEINK